MKKSIMLLFLLGIIACEDKDTRARLESESKKTQEEIVRVTAEIENNNAQIAELKKEIESFKSKTEAAREETSKYKNQSKQLTIQLEDLQKKALEASKTPESRLAETQMKTIMNALEMYKKDYGTYPTTEQGLKVLSQNARGRNIPYLKDIPKDPWQREYWYRNIGGVYEIITRGADGKKGGTGENTDIRFTSSN